MDEEGSSIGFESVPLEELYDTFRGAGRPEVRDDGLIAHSLDVEEFVEAFCQPDEPQAEYEEVFNKIDVNANGRIGWDEMVAFLMTSTSCTKEANSFDAECYQTHYTKFSRSDESRWASHSDTINKIVFHPRQPVVFTSGQDGAVKMWNTADLSHEKTLINGGPWITDLTYVPPCPPLGTSGYIVSVGIDKVVSVFDSHTGELVRCYKGRRKKKSNVITKPEVLYRTPFVQPRGAVEKGHNFLPQELLGEELYKQGPVQPSDASNVLAHFRKRDKLELFNMERLEASPFALSNIMAQGKEHLLVGGSNGILLAYDISRDLASFSETTLVCDNYVGHPISRHSHVASYGWPTGHIGGVNAVKSVPSLDSIITAGGDCSLRLLDVETGSAVRVLGVPLAPAVTELSPNYSKKMQHGVMEKASIELEKAGHLKAVLNFAWCEDRRLICSCGQERTALMWNPYISKPIVTLKGHRTPLVDVCFNPEQNQIISLSVDKVVKVWDIRTFQTIQTLGDENKYTNVNSTIGAIGYDAKHKRVITGTTQLHARSYAGFQGIEQNRRHEANAQKDQKEKPAGAPATPVVVAVLHSRILKRIVVVDEASATVWDVKQQNPLLSWTIPGGLTSAALDIHERRLLVGKRNGEVTIWNFCNAQYLKTCANYDGSGCLEEEARQAATKEGTALCRTTLRRDMFTDVNFCLFVVQEEPFRQKIIVSGKANRLYLYEDTDTDAEVAFTKSIQLDPTDKGASCCMFLPPCILVVGTLAGGLALVYLAEHGRPTSIPRRHKVRLNGNLDGPLYEETAPVLLPQKKLFMDVTQVDCVCETILLVKRTGRCVLTSHGNGAVSVWNVPRDRPKMCKHENFSFLVTHEIGEGVPSMTLNGAETRLACGSAAGYFSVYDVHLFSTQPESIVPQSVSRLRCVRIASVSVTRITFLSGIALYAASLATADVILTTEEGYIVTKLGGAQVDLSERVTARYPRQQHTAAYERLRVHSHTMFLFDQFYTTSGPITVQLGELRRRFKEKFVDDPTKGFQTAITSLFAFLGSRIGVDEECTLQTALRSLRNDVSITYLGKASETSTNTPSWTQPARLGVASRCSSLSEHRDLPDRPNGPSRSHVTYKLTEQSITRVCTLPPESTEESEKSRFSRGFRKRSRHGEVVVVGSQMEANATTRPSLAGTHTGSYLDYIDHDCGRDTEEAPVEEPFTTKVENDYFSKRVKTRRAIGGIASHFATSPIGGTPATSYQPSLQELSIGDVPPSSIFPAPPSIKRYSKARYRYPPLEAEEEEVSEAASGGVTLVKTEPFSLYRLQGHSWLQEEGEEEEEEGENENIVASPPQSNGHGWGGRGTTNERQRRAPKVCGVGNVGGGSLEALQREIDADLVKYAKVEEEEEEVVLPSSSPRTATAETEARSLGKISLLVASIRGASVGSGGGGDAESVLHHDSDTDSVTSAVEIQDRLLLLKAQQSAPSRKVVSKEKGSLLVSVQMVADPKTRHRKLLSKGLVPNSIPGEGALGAKRRSFAAPEF